MDPVGIYHTFKIQAFSQGYWICQPTRPDTKALSFLAVVIPPYGAKGKFEIYCGSHLLKHIEIEPPLALEHVLMRLDLPGRGGKAVAFTVDASALGDTNPLVCRDFHTGRQIGCSYFLPAPDYDVRSSAGNNNMLRAVRTDDMRYFGFTGFDDCVKLTSIIEKYLPLQERRKVLDWGVGSGRVSQHMRRNNALEVFGTDIDPVNMLQLHSAGYPPSNFKLMAPGGPIPFEDQSFDVCFGISVFTHLTEPLQFEYLTEICRILKPGGIGIFSIHGFIHFFSRINDGATFYKWIDKGLLVTGNNSDLDKDFIEVTEKQLYVDVLHTPRYLYAEWTRFFASLHLIEAPNAYGHDLIVCQK